MGINCWLHNNKKERKRGKKANPPMYLGLLILYIQQVGRMWVTGCTNLGGEAKFGICTLLQFSVTTSLLKDRLLQRMSCEGMIITTQPCQLHSILRKFYSNSYLVPFRRANLQAILITKALTLEFYICTTGVSSCTFTTNKAFDSSLALLAAAF